MASSKRMPEMMGWKCKRGSRGPYPAHVCPKERQRRIRIATNYVVDRMPTWQIAKIWDISEATVRRYVREVYTYPEEDAGRLRAIAQAEQDERARLANREVGRPFP